MGASSGSGMSLMGASSGSDISTATTLPREAGPHSAIGKSRVLGSIPGLATYFRFSFAFPRRAVVSYWQKYVHEVLVNRLGGLSLPRKSVVRLTDRPNITVDVYRGR